RKKAGITRSNPSDEGTSIAPALATQRSSHVFSQACWNFISAGPELDVDLSPARRQRPGRGKGRNRPVLDVGLAAGRSDDPPDQAEIWQGNAGRSLRGSPRRAALAIFAGQKGSVFRSMGRSPHAGSEGQRRVCADLP